MQERNPVWKGDCQERSLGQSSCSMPPCVPRQIKANPRNAGPQKWPTTLRVFYFNSEHELVQFGNLHIHSATLKLTCCSAKNSGDLLFVSKACFCFFGRHAGFVLFNF